MTQVVERTTSLMENMKKLGIEITEKELTDILDGLKPLHFEEPLDQLHPLTRTFYRLSQKNEFSE